MPVRPEPCGAPAFPELPVGPDMFVPVDLDADGQPDALAAGPGDVALLAAWIVAVADWHDAVIACPYLRPGPDLRVEMGAAE